MSKVKVDKPQKSIFSLFPRSFWTVNFMELFERGAYYGMNSVLAVYLTQHGGGGLGFAKADVGFLLGLVYAITYILPIIGGALADRYGYRRMLLIAFSLLSSGYMATAFVSDYWFVFLTLGIMATGSGLFKPVISGTIARTTNEKTSGFGFGVYYWMINMGALVAPLIIYYLRGISWKYVFIFSSLATGLMFLPTLFIYKDPKKPENVKNIKEVLKGAVTVLSDSRFMLMVFLYSMFWILYFQNFGTVLWYLRDFIDPTPVNNFFASMGLHYSFRPEHVTVINAGTIVLLQVLISYITKKTKPLPTMMTGMIIGSLGFFFLAFSSNIWIFIAGIAVFSIGEMTCHPKYISYIGLIAPSDKKAIYMGYAFIYGVIGSLVGSNVGGELYDRILTPLSSGCVRTGVASTLRNFWLMFGFLGILSMGGLFLFNKFLGKNTKKTRKIATRIMKSAYVIFILIGILFISLKVISIFSPNDKSQNTPVITLSFDKSGSSLVAGGWDNSISAWKVSTGNRYKHYNSCKSDTKWISILDKSKNHLLLCSKTGEFETWSLEYDKVKLKKNLKSKNLLAISMINKKLLAVSPAKGSINIINLKTKKVINSVKSQTSKIISAKFNHNGTKVISGSNDGTVKVWDLDKHKVVNTLISGTSDIIDVVFSSDGLKAASSSENGEVVIWDLKSNKKIASLNESSIPSLAQNSALSLVFSPNSRLLAMGLFDGVISLVDTKTHKEIRRLERTYNSSISSGLKKSAKTFLQALILISIGLLGLMAGRIKE